MTDRTDQPARQHSPVPTPRTVHLTDARALGCVIDDPDPAETLRRMNALANRINAEAPQTRANAAARCDHRDDVPALPPTPRPPHQPHAHADHRGVRYSCTGCAYTTPRVPHADPAAAAAILRHCGRPDRPARRIPASTIHAAKATLHDAEQLLRRRRPLGYSRKRRTELRLASAHAALCAARRAGGAR